jgi:hypothetical protein
MKNQYKSLEVALELALIRASKGKGKIRHANDKPFEHQDICEEVRYFGIAGNLQQIRKKARELARFDMEEAQVNELLDIIVDAAAAVIVLNEEMKK